MKGIMTINVVLWGEVIGRMNWDDVRQVATFQFSERYHDLPYNIMPTRPAKPRPAFLGAAGDKYHGLPPFIADSLPDHWGSVIFDKWAREKGIQPKDCNPLLKLAYIGRRGLGALEFVPEIDTANAEAGDLADLESMAQEIYRKRSEVVIREDERNTFESFARLGSPPGGAHSKILIAINDKDSSIISGQTDPEEGFTQYILKFKEDYEVPSCEIEYVYYLMAKEAGIDMMPSRLIEINGRRHFLTQRFDRRDGRKLLTQTMAALIPSASDYQNLFFLWMNQQGLNCSAGCASMWLREIPMTTTRISRSSCTKMVIGNWLRLMTSLLHLTSGRGLMMTSIRWGYIPRDATFQNKTSSLSVKISRFRSLRQSLRKSKMQFPNSEFSPVRTEYRRTGLTVFQKF